MLPTKRDRQWLPDIFNDFFDTNWMVRANATAPAINVIESDKEYKVEIAAPGMTREDFDVRVNDQNQLVVSMEKKQEKEEKSGEEKKEEGRYLRREFSYTRFQQAMILPDNIEKDKIEAKVHHGVLQISIPKSAALPEQSKERQIQIR